MPTARELLEQADALMRRNRQEAAHGARESAAQGARSGASALAPPPAPPRSEPRPAAARAEDDNIPVLKDVVTPPARGSDDDVPILTDAVDEIEVAAPDVDEGEPSDWLAPPAEDESVLGPAPPSVAVVPPAPAGAPPRPFREAPPHARTPEIDDLSQRVYGDRDTDVTIRRPAPALGAPPAPIPEIEDLAEASLADVDPDVTWTRPIGPSPSAPAAALVTARETHAPPREEAPATAARTVPTGAEFEALAEEIRMQVLQRIDMFTDTGLHERLGERLKPIVDRASADLVEAINEHVGEILRAYVAEAIEREIDRWKSGR
jgi:hypothetical protein